MKKMVLVLIALLTLLNPPPLLCGSSGMEEDVESLGNPMVPPSTVHEEHHSSSFAQFSTIFFSAVSNTVNSLGVNFSIAISMGFLGSIFSSLFFKTTSVLTSLAIMKKFFLYFLVYSTFGYATMAFIDTKPTLADIEKPLKAEFNERFCSSPTKPFPIDTFTQ